MYTFGTAMELSPLQADSDAITTREESRARTAAAAL